MKHLGYRSRPKKPKPHESRQSKNKKYRKQQKKRESRSKPKRQKFRRKQSGCGYWKKKLRKRHGRKQWLGNKGLWRFYVNERKNWHSSSNSSVQQLVVVLQLPVPMFCASTQTNSTMHSFPTSLHQLPIQRNYNCY